MSYKATTISPANCHSWYRLILALMLISLSGCATFRPDLWYLHNPAHKDLADQAKSNWTPVKDNLWQSLLNNQKLTAAAELQEQRLLNQSVVTNKHLATINMTWEQTLKNLKKYRKSLVGEDGKGGEAKQIEGDQNKALEQSTEIGKKVQQLINEAKTKKEAIKTAENNIKLWQDKLALIEKASHDYLLQQANKTETGETSLKDLQKQATDIVGKGGLGKLKEGLVDQPPGVTLEILSLGADLAKAELDRAQAIAKRLQEENNLYNKRQEEITTTINWIDMAMTDIEDPITERNSTIMASIQKSLKSHTSPDTQGFILALQKYVLADDLYTLNNGLYQVSKEALIHYYQIEDSAISAKEREALIQRGLETLAIYHNGGITQEEINSIIQAAQAVALAVISAGVI